MSLAQLNSIAVPIETAPPAPVGETRAPPSFSPSPARELQRRLTSQLHQPEPARWSPRRSLAFILVASLLLWAGIIGAGFALVRLLA